MLTTTKLALKKPETTDARSSLRTAISDNADLLESAFGRFGYAEVLTDQTTNSSTAVDLTTSGPSVTLTVPANALVAIHARATLGTQGVVNNVPGYVFLYEDAASLARILAPAVADGGPRWTTPGVADGTLTTLGGWMVFPTTAGAHTYKLRYANQGGAGTTAFKDRKLWARVLTF